MEETGEGVQKEGGDTATVRGGGEEARIEELQFQEEGVAEKRPRTKKSDTETEAVGGEAGPSLPQCKKGHMTNIYLTDSDEEAIVDFVKDHEELYEKNISRTKQGRSVSGSSSPTVVSCLSRCKTWQYLVYYLASKVEGLAEKDF